VSSVLLVKLTGSQLVKKFPIFYGTRRFITAFTSARHLSVSWVGSIQSYTPTTHFLKIHLNIILLSSPGSFKWSLSLRFPHENPVYTSAHPHTCYMLRPSHPRLYLWQCLQAKISCWRGAFMLLPFRRPSKFTVEQPMKAQSKSRGIAVLFL
jgi:hypothetical protein